MSEKKKTKFGQFLQKVGNTFGDVAEVGGTLLKGTAAGSALDMLGNVLEGKAVDVNLSQEERNLAEQFKRELEKDKQDFRQEWQLAQLEFEKDLKQLEVADKESAREIYDKSKDYADKLADSLMKRNLIYIAVLVGLFITGTIFSQLYNIQQSIVAVVSGTIMTVVTSLLSERNQVVGFYFGSSMGSKDKDKKLNNIK